MTIADLSERALIALVQARLGAAPSWLLVGIGDDAAVVAPERNHLEVLTVDALVEGVHFDRRFTPPDAIGYRALAVNLSDIAAMGAAPRLALLSFALPGSLPVADFQAIVAGLVDLATKHRVSVAGGNLTSTPGPLTLDVTVAGTVRRRHVLTRAGARPGDEVYVTGTIGSAAAGLQLLQQRLTTDESGLTADERRLVTAYLRPEPRVRIGTLLGRNRAATACIDLSDGLADGVHRLAQAGGVGIELDAASVPLDPAARAWFEARGVDPVLAAATGGDDYELLFTARRRTLGRLAAARHHGSTPLTRIGVCTADSAVVVRREDSRIELPEGYRHFGRRV